MSNNLLFDKSIQLLTGSVISKTTPYKTFLHIKSTFKDAWYNFIVPQTLPDTLDWKDVKTVIEKEQKNGFSLSYYIKEIFLEEYQKYFETCRYNKLGTEYYMALRQEEKYKDVPGELIEVDELSLEKYVTKFHTGCGMI